MERFATFTLPVAGANAVQTQNMVLPANLARWSLHVVPLDDTAHGVPNDPAIEVLYGIGATYYSTNPAGTSTATTNVDNVITRNDQVSKVQVKVTHGAQPPDLGMTIELYGTRDFE